LSNIVRPQIRDMWIGGALSGRLEGGKRRSLIKDKSAFEILMTLVIKAGDSGVAVK
jgi:hypothetical protein